MSLFPAKWPHIATTCIVSTATMGCRRVSRNHQPPTTHIHPYTQWAAQLVILTWPKTCQEDFDFFYLPSLGFFSPSFRFVLGLKKHKTVEQSKHQRRLACGISFVQVTVSLRGQVFGGSLLSLDLVGAPTAKNLPRYFDEFTTMTHERPSVGWFKHMPHAYWLSFSGLGSSQLFNHLDSGHGVHSITDLRHYKSMCSSSHISPTESLSQENTLCRSNVFLPVFCASWTMFLSKDGSQQLRESGSGVLGDGRATLGSLLLSDLLLFSE